VSVTYEDEREVALWLCEHFLRALHAVHDCLDGNADFAEEFQNDHLVDPVVFDEQDTLVFLAQSRGQFCKHLLLVVGDLLSAVLVAIGAHFAALLRIEDDCKSRGLERLEDEEHTVVGLERLVLVFLRLLKNLTLLGEIRDDYDGSR
jgi:hypothetical protein